MKAFTSSDALSRYLGGGSETQFIADQMFENLDRFRCGERVTHGGGLMFATHARTGRLYQVWLDPRNERVCAEPN